MFWHVISPPPSHSPHSKLQCEVSSGFFVCVFGLNSGNNLASSASERCKVIIFLKCFFILLKLTQILIKKKRREGENYDVKWKEISLLVQEILFDLSEFGL